MSEMTYVRIAQACYPKADWPADVVLLSGEVGWESDTGQFKVGNGSSPWSQLNYFQYTTLNGKAIATEDYVQQEIGKIDIPEVNLDGYATEEYVRQEIEKIDIPETNLDDYATKEYVQQEIEKIDTSDVNLENYATKEYVQQEIEKIDIPSQPTDYITTDYLNEVLEGYIRVPDNPQDGCLLAYNNGNWEALPITVDGAY